jgi:hypothetical protein
MTVFDANLAIVTDKVDLPGISGAISMTFNPLNNYIYCLSSDTIFVVDPTYPNLVGTFSIYGQPRGCVVNPINGDIYVTYPSSSIVDIWSYDNLTDTPTETITTTGNTFDLVFNESEKDMYIVQDDGILLRVNGSSRTVQTSYSIPGLTYSIFYEPTNSSIYVFGSTGLINLNNGVTQSIGIGVSPFNELVYNNILGSIVISQQDGFSSILKTDMLNV